MFRNIRWSMKKTPLLLWPIYIHALTLTNKKEKAKSRESSRQNRVTVSLRSEIEENKGIDR